MTAPPPAVRVLVVDDEEPIRNALKRYLGKLGYDVVLAAGGEEALDALRRHESIALMLSDIRMPGMSGLDMVPQALEISPDLAILMVSAVNDATTAALCMQRGAVDYLTKPLELEDLGRTVQRAVQRRELVIGQRTLNQQIKEEVARRTAEFQRERARLERVSVATLDALVNALEAKDPYLRGHSQRVADLAATLAAQLQLRDDDIEQARLAGRLHDIGKIGTREDIMNKPGRLSPEEYAHIQQHVIIGSQILAPLDHLGPVINAVRSHHERWDGSGYPDRRKGEEIPLLGRIVGTAEVWDALSTSRPYQAKLSPDQALLRMEELAGTVLDPVVVTALSEVVKRRGSLVYLVDGREVPLEMREWGVEGTP
ncbi:MAG TPA: HD domain-containing phosphohydrolase [Gemmatimonadales bacterium]